MKAIATVSFVAAFLWSQAGPTAAQQSTDPRVIMNCLLRKAVDEYDWNKPFPKPVIPEPRVPPAATPPIDFSEYGEATPTQPATPPNPTCTTITSGGKHETYCD